MTIRSTDDAVAPIIDPNWLRSEADKPVAIQAHRHAGEVWAGIPAHIGDEFRPDPNVTSDTDLRSYIKRNITPVHHASSACAMGKVGHPQTVVDFHAPE